MTWTRLIRFADDSGRETFGEPCIENEQQLMEQLEANTLYATEYKGESITSALVKGEKVHVKSLLDILRPADVPIIRCIGLNYIKHSKAALDRGNLLPYLTTHTYATAYLVQEGGRKPPPYPSVFIKPATSVAGYKEDIPIPKIAQDGTLDYEGELVGALSYLYPSYLLPHLHGYCVHHV